MQLRAPKSLLVNDHQAFMWTFTVADVPCLAVWWITDGSLRVSYPVNDSDWSPFLKLGQRWAPRHDLSSAHDTIRAWATEREARLSA